MAKVKIKQSNKEQIMERMFHIRKMILEHYPTYEIWRKASKKWGVSSRQTDRYISHINKKIEREYAKKENNLVSKHIERRSNMAHEAIKDRDIRTALLIEKDIAEIEGIYAPKKVNFKAEIALDVEAMKEKAKRIFNQIKEKN